MKIDLIYYVTCYLFLSGTGSLRSSPRLPKKSIIDSSLLKVNEPASLRHKRSASDVNIQKRSDDVNATSGDVMTTSTKTTATIKATTKGTVSGDGGEKSERRPEYSLSAQITNTGK